MKQLARRDALQAVAGLASAAAVGTVTGRFRSAPSTTALDVIPQTADALVDADTDALRRDDGLRTLTTAALQQYAQYAAGDADPPRDADALRSELEADFDTDPKTVHRATAFGDIGDDELFGGYAGVVFRAELSAEDVKSGIENMDDVDFSELEESGTVVYEPDGADGPWVGSLGSDRVVVGTEAAVADAIDVASGDRAAIGGPVGSAYEDTRPAPVRFASRLPDPSGNEGVPAELSAGNGRQSVDLTPLDHATTLAGAVYRDGDVRGLEATLDAADTAAASDVATVVRELRERAESELRDDAVADVVGDIAVERDGTTVTTSVSRTVSELERLTR